MGLRYLAFWSLLATVFNSTGAHAEDVRLTLPARTDAVVGAEIGIEFDNLVLASQPETLQWEVQCDVGVVGPKKWSITPQPADVGTHPWTVCVKRDGNVVAEKSLDLIVVPSDIAKGMHGRLLIVGDSLTHASLTANNLHERLSQPNQPQMRFLGTHRPSVAAEGVAHEGYGGWTWQRFVTHYEAAPDVAKRKFSSPFVFKDEGAEPRLDVARYIAEKCNQQPPDVVFFLLGINDCFSAKADDPAALDSRIDQVFEHAETLLKAFRDAAPKASLAICLTTPPNSRDDAFNANYKGRYTRQNWKRIQQRLVERQLEHFGQREQEHIFVVPTELNLDPVDGYPVDNAVHPNRSGYEQIAATLHAWLLAHLGRPQD